jgi:hypothetical protein
MRFGSKTESQLLPSSFFLQAPGISLQFVNHLIKSTIAQCRHCVCIFALRIATELQRDNVPSQQQQQQ